MGRAVKILFAIALLLTLGSCASFYISSKQETEEFSIWSDPPSEMTTLDWFGVMLLVLAGAMAFAAYRLYSQETETEKQSNVI